MIQPRATAPVYGHIEARDHGTVMILGSMIRPRTLAGRLFPMTRCTALLLVLAACGSSHREVAKISAPGDGLCHEAGGCEAPVPGEPQFKLPDSDHPGPQEPPVGILEVRDATCEDVGVNLAALELGNYAEQDKLAPVVAKYRGQCAKLKLTKGERQCAFESTDRPSVTWCAPRIMPGAQVALVEPRECIDITKQMRLRTEQAQPGQNGWQKQLAAMQASCEQDRWTVPFRDCVNSVPFPTYVDSYCGNAAPAPLRKKLQDRYEHIK